jgi:hypothetical protein
MHPARELPAGNVLGDKDKTPALFKGIHGVQKIIPFGFTSEMA